MPEFEKVELEEKLRVANGITRKPGGRELLYDVFPTGAPFSFEALDKFSALCYTEIGILHKSFPRHFKNQESQTMKQRFRKLLSLAAAGVLAAALFVTPAAAADAAENGNEAFDRWATEAAIAEKLRMEQLTGLPEDPQAAFEEAAAILEAIENARVMTPIADDEPALIDRDGEPLENETPEKLWAEFIAQFGGGSGLSDEEEFPYELRFFTVSGEERFAIYDTRSGRAAAGWQGSTGKWWYSYGDGTWASGWTTINGLTYYFDPNNNDYMVHGWLDDEDSYSQYFMGTPGQMDSGAKYTFGWLNDKEAGGTDETSRDESNIDLSMDNFDVIGGNILGMTLSKNSEDEWLLGKSLTSDTDNVFSIGFITYSIVLIHPKTVDSLSASEKEYLIRHETGHAVGLRHPCEASELELQDTLEKCLMFPVLSKPGDKYYPYFSTSLKSYDLEELRKTYPN